MADWGPVFVAVILFVLLTPGLLFQLPGNRRCLEFGNFHTSAAAIIVHSVLYFGLICVFLLAIKAFQTVAVTYDQKTRKQWKK
ncbi:uncharacterized protein LOC111488037 isoform X1 [Cucurbita maxima]|uniref:Uncharacterized protein LOC111488037 isoform X1 n=1 Tax=Cucurbita maxima TaxID=3661 RepID=A0A6J1JUR0_CUCMA|nr:uncharacterized protein LOC111488037 isoform X1 [Cucurbita maxima]